MQQFRVGSNEAGQRLDKFLRKYFKEASAGFLYKMLRKKNITLNQKKAEGKEMLQQGDLITFFFSGDTYEKFRGMQDVSPYKKAYESLPPIPVIFENKDLLVLNKPAGILSQKALPEDCTANEWMIGYLLSQGTLKEEQLSTFHPSVCHRLDRNTSGLLLCGKSLEGSREMSLLLRRREQGKFYRTFVKGQIREPLQLTGYLKKDNAANRVTVLTHRPYEEKGWERIETVCMPLAVWKKKDMTYLEVKLITGKAHQIRAHMASLKHPLLGDGKYGDTGWNSHMGWERGQLLHACRLEFPQIRGPLKELSGKVLTAPEPPVFERIKEQEGAQWLWRPGIPED
ncbi:MAG: RluA family pseudouridine synthase [Lachnospiraceae bacterium]|nr:RluA family pseudouridine synthase [Lachnospiraceae bacterium]